MGGVNMDGLKRECPNLFSSITKKKKKLRE